MREPILVCTVGNPKHKAPPSSINRLAHERRRKPDLVAVHTPHAMRPADLFSRQTRSGF
jgi:N6-adenosine-specific RNA methylase IME4